jgi:hypothetical protein
VRSPAEDLSVLAPEGVETLLIGAGSLVTSVPETGVIIMYPEAKACVLCHYRVKSRILIEGRISHDEVPLDAPEIGLGHPDYHHHLRIQVDRRR